MENFTITDSGNIGIGTTTPSYKLDVQGGSTNVGTLYGTSVMYGTLGITDTRDSNKNPEVYNMGLTGEFKSNSSNSLSDGGTYNAVFSVRQWSRNSDWTGGGVHQLGFTQNGNLWQRYSQTTGSWGPWYKILNTANGGVTTSCTTVNYIPKMTTSSNIGCSQLFDDGTNVGIGTATPTYKLEVQGTTAVSRVRGNGATLASPSFLVGDAATTAFEMEFTHNAGAGWIDTHA